MALTAKGYSTTVAACRRADRIGDAKALVDVMQSLGMELNACDYYCGIAGRVETKDWKGALALLDDMRAKVREKERGGPDIREKDRRDSSAVR